MEYLFMYAFLISGAVIILIGLLISIDCRVRAKKADKFPAEIIAIRDKTISRGRTAQRLFCPVVKFTMYGSERTAEHYIYLKMTDIHLHRGDKTTVCINRSDPKTFYFADSGAPSSTAGAVIMSVGVALSIIGLIIMLVK